MAVKEKDISEKVIKNELSWWEETLLTKWGRVPIKMGVDVKYADIVALIIDENKAIPYLIVEIKRKKN